MTDRDMSDKKVEAAGKRSHFKYRVTKTISLVLIWISMGLFLEVAGPTLVDLKDIINVNYEEIARVLSARAVGFFIGSFFGGLLTDIFSGHIDITIAVSFMVAGASTAVIPWCPNLVLVGICFHITGLSEGFIANATTLLVVQLWGENAPPPIHALHCAFGVGAFLAPYIARPFLSKQPDINNSTFYNNETANDTTRIPTNLSDELVVTSPATDETLRTYMANISGMYQVTSTPANNVRAALNVSWIENSGYESRIDIPYLIIGLIAFFAGTVFLGYYLKGKPRGMITDTPRKSIKKVLSINTCISGDKMYGIGVLIALFLFAIHVIGGERAYSKFIFSYAVESEVKFHKDDAAVLNSVFWISFTAGRLFAVITAKWIQPGFMIVAEIIGVAVSSIVLSFLGHKHTAVLYVFTGTMGFFLAPIFPSMVAWTDRYIKLTAMISALLFIGGSTGAFIYQWVAGYLFENLGPRTLMYVMIGYAACLALKFTVLKFMAAKLGARYKNDEILEKNYSNVPDRDKEVHDMQSAL